MNRNGLVNYFKDSAAVMDQVMAADLADVGGGLLPEVLRYALFNGGKRIRPQLTVLVGGMIVSGTQWKEEPLYRLAIIFEYLHAASLLHDDVIDGSETRRGKSTTHTVYGVTPVILAGDFLHARAMTLAGTLGGQECVALVGRATQAMVAAEFLQMQAAGEVGTTEKDYFQIVDGKTGALITSACESGAVLCGGDERQREAARAYGESVGRAFQIVDDLLDYLGDPGKTGKAVGNDLIEGKMTLPLIHALRSGGVSERKFLSGVIEDSAGERRRKITEVTEVIRKCGGFEYARQKAVSLIDQAVSGLDEAFVDCSQKEILKGLAEYVLLRDK